MQLGVFQSPQSVIGDFLVPRVRNDDGELLLPVFEDWNEKLRG